MGEIEKSLFTFIVEYQGNTLVEQYSGADCDDAIRAWYDHTRAPIKLNEVRDSLYEQVPLTGLKHVWFLSLLDDDDVLFLINIVLTVGA